LTYGYDDVFSSIFSDPGWFDEILGQKEYCCDVVNDEQGAEG
jgi:hypothetical protein